MCEYVIIILVLLSFANQKWQYAFKMKINTKHNGDFVN